MSRINLIAFRFIYPYFAESTYIMMTQIHALDTVFIPRRTNVNMQGCVAKEMENIWQILEFRVSGGGLIERVAYFKF